ncbi:MAG: Na+ dependent nucleoside transporter N-terminal domain-containing protein [Desulfosalsimonadaceae bacterium]
MSLQSVVGFFVFAALAWCISEDRRGACLRTIWVGMAAQFGLALVLK